MAHIPLGVAPPSQVTWIGIIRYIGTEKLIPYLIYLLSFGKNMVKCFTVQFITLVIEDLGWEHTAAVLNVNKYSKDAGHGRKNNETKITKQLAIPESILNTNHKLWI